MKNSSETQIVDQEMALFKTAFDLYVATIKANNLEPSDNFLPYKFNMQFEQYQWYMFGEEWAEELLRELTNTLNIWHYHLHRWHAWSESLSGFDEKDAWHLRNEFLDTTVFFCLYRPSAVKDQIIYIATNIFHNIRLGILDGEYKDVLEDDSNKQLGRDKRFKQLKKIIATWPSGQRLIEGLKKIDNDQYKEATRDFRNQSSHKIPPGLGIGITNMRTRFIKAKTVLKKVSYNLYEDVEVPGELSVYYGFGGTPPLELEYIRKTNLDQLDKVKNIYHELLTLISVAIKSLPARSDEIK